MERLVRRCLSKEGAIVTCLAIFATTRVIHTSHIVVGSTRARLCRLGTFGAEVTLRTSSRRVCASSRAVGTGWALTTTIGILAVSIVAELTSRAWDLLERTCRAVIAFRARSGHIWVRTAGLRSGILTLRDLNRINQ